MKRKALIAIVGTLLFVCGITLTGLYGETEEVTPSTIYGAFVDSYIQKCEAKAQLLDSGSYNIRKDAIQATLKGAFIESNRAAMIDYLMENNVKANPDRVVYHLNRQFTESVQPQKVYAVLLKEHAGR